MLISFRTRKSDRAIEAELNKFSTNAERAEYVRKALEFFIYSNIQETKLNELSNKMDSIIDKLDNASYKPHVVIKSDGNKMDSEAESKLSKLSKSINSLLDW